VPAAEVEDGVPVFETERRNGQLAKAPLPAEEDGGARG
jgi:hypothetical protein